MSITRCTRWSDSWYIILTHDPDTWSWDMIQIFLHAFRRVCWLVIDSLFFPWEHFNYRLGSNRDRTLYRDWQVTLNSTSPCFDFFLEHKDLYPFGNWNEFARLYSCLCATLKFSLFYGWLVSWWHLTFDKDRYFQFQYIAILGAFNRDQLISIWCHVYGLGFIL